MLVPPESSSAVLVIIRSKSVSICNRSRARLVDTTLKSTFNAEHFVCRTAGCPGLYWMVSAQFSLKMCIAA